MSKRLAIAFVAATLLGGSVASAQSIDFGSRGPSVDLRSDRQRERDEVREQARRDAERRAAFSDRRDDRGDRRRGDNLSTGSVDCKVVTVRERDEYGNTVTRETRRCR